MTSGWEQRNETIVFVSLSPCPLVQNGFISLILARMGGEVHSGDVVVPYRAFGH